MSPSESRATGTRREREREEMKRLITGAARKLFVTEGYESTTIRRIAEAIEYTPGAIYSYFKDKDAILYALHQEGFLELQRRFLSAIVPGKNPVEQLAQLGEAYVALQHQGAELPAITAHLARSGQRLTDIYAQAQAQNRSPARVAAQQAEALLYPR